MIAGMNRRRSLLTVRSNFSYKPQHLHILGSVSTDSPEVTGSASIFPTSTKNSQSTFPPQTTSSVSSNSYHRRNSDIGAIASGTAGGIAMAALIAGIVSWFTIRRRRARSAQVAVTYPPPMIKTPKLYVRIFYFRFRPAMSRPRNLANWIIALPRTRRIQPHTQYSRQR